MYTCTMTLMDIFTMWFWHLSGHGPNKMNFFKLMNMHIYMNACVYMSTCMYAYTISSIVKKREGNQALYNVNNCPDFILMVIVRSLLLL